MKSKRFLVTGGGGFVGFHVGLALYEAGHEVTLFDVKKPHPEWEENLGPSSNNKSKGSWAFRLGDIRRKDELYQAFRGQDCVIHTASYGLSGRDQMRPAWSLTEEINVQGTKNVIESCCEQNVRALVYTSTVNVIYGGEKIINGDESMPYYPLHLHGDHYSRTKSIAEQMVLLCNGKTTTDGTVLNTCALRLSGVVGPKDQRVLPRIVWAIEAGLMRFNYFDEDGAQVQFIHIRNVVQAHLKAAFKLLDDDSSQVVAGQAYFIADGPHINNLEYFRPIFDDLGHPFPTKTLPMWLMWVIVYVIEFVYLVVYKFYDFTPFMTKTELLKTGITHFFSIQKAREHLDYQPIKPNDLEDVVQSIARHKKRTRTE